MKNWIDKQFRKKSRVYILPTKMGGYLNGLIFLMFLLSIGYSNNLLLIFTTFLLGFNLLWLIQTHFYMARLKPDQVLIHSGHAGMPLVTQITWRETPKAPHSWKLTLESDKGKFLLDAQSIIIHKRGVYSWKYLRTETSNPFGLYKTWIYFPLLHSSLVFPPLLPHAELPLSGKDSEGELLQDKKGPEDFRGLASYEQNESRKISWKHYARSGELLVKEGEEQKSPVMNLELSIPHDENLKEAYLSYVATQLVEAHRRGISFSLKVKDQYSSDLSECLKVLAQC